MPTMMTERQIEEFLKHTPMRTEGPAGRQRREAQHRALRDDQQPWMVCIFGGLGYDTLWIGSTDQQAAEREAQWWRDQLTVGLVIRGYARALPHEIMIRRQHDLDALVAAIQRCNRQRDEWRNELTI